MPTVPFQQNQRVQLQALPGSRVSTSAPIEAFGGGAAVQGVADQFTKIVVEEKQKADDAVTQDAYAKSVELRNKLMYDPQNGAMTKKGKDAFGVVDDYSTEYDKQADEIEKGLTNDTQRQMFSKIRAQQKNDLNTSLSQHTMTEAKKYETQTAEAALATTRSDAVLNYQNPGAVQSSINTQKALIESHAAKNGWSPEQLQEATTKAESQTHADIVKRMLSNGDDLAATSYFQSNKDGIIGQDVAQIEGALQEGSLRGETQRQATAIMASKPKDLKSALDEARKITNPKVQESTVQEVKLRFSEAEQSERISQENLYQQGSNVVEQTKQRPSPVIWDALSPSARSALDSRITQLRQGIQPETSWDDYYNLQTMASSPQTKQEFLRTNLGIYRTKMADSEFKELVNLQAGLRKNDPNADKLLDGYRTDTEIVNSSLSAAGIDPTPKPGSDAATKVNQARSKIDGAIKNWQVENKKKAPSDVVQQITNDFLVKGVTSKGILWDDTKMLFELEPGEAFAIDTKDIPVSERREIEAALRLENKPVNDENIMGKYNRHLQRLNRGR